MTPIADEIRGLALLLSGEPLWSDIATVALRLNALAVDVARAENFCNEIVAEAAENSRLVHMTDPVVVKFPAKAHSDRSRE